MNAPYRITPDPSSIEVDRVLDEGVGASAAAQHRAGGPTDLSRCASQPKALIPDAAPQFTRSPPAQPFPSSGLKRYSMLAYGGNDQRIGRESIALPPLERDYCARSDTAAIAKCRFEAGWQKRIYVKVRDPFGRIIFDGLTEWAETEMALAAERGEAA